MTGRPRSPASYLYNAEIETAGRFLILSRHVGRLTLEEARILDLFLSFPADLGAPVNIHQPTPGRANRWTFREHQVLKALRHAMLLTDAEEGTDGLLGIDAGDRDLPFAKTRYGNLVDGASRWLTESIVTEGRKDFFRRAAARIDWLLVNDPLGRPADDMLERFLHLRITYRTDLIRLDFIRATAVWMQERESGQAPESGLGTEFYDVALAAEATETRQVTANAKGLEDTIRELKAEAA